MHVPDLRGLPLGNPQRLLQATPAASRGHWLDLKDGFSLTVHSRALLTVLIAWNVAMFSNAAVNVAEPRLAFRAFDAGTFGLGLMMGCSGIGLAIGAYLASSGSSGADCRTSTAPRARVDGCRIGLAAMAPNVWVAAACVVISGRATAPAVVCNALLVQRGAPDALRGRAFAVLMSSNVAMLTLGMIVAATSPTSSGHAGSGPPRRRGGARQVVGFALSRTVSSRPGVAQPEPQPSTRPRQSPRSARSERNPL